MMDVLWCPKLHPPPHMCPSPPYKGGRSSLSSSNWMGVVNEAPVDFWKNMLCVVYRKVLFDVHIFLRWGLRLYSVCLLKRNINVNLTWNCKKLCECPSISRHLLTIFENKYENRYINNILYIEEQLLLTLESDQEVILFCVLFFFLIFFY